MIEFVEVKRFGNLVGRAGGAFRESHLAKAGESAVNSRRKVQRCEVAVEFFCGVVVCFSGVGLGVE